MLPARRVLHRALFLLTPSPDTSRVYLNRAACVTLDDTDAVPPIRPLPPDEASPCFSANQRPLWIPRLLDLLRAPPANQLVSSLREMDDGSTSAPQARERAHRLGAMGPGMVIRQRD